MVRINKKRATRKWLRQNRKTRKGGGRFGELRFRYTKDPKRVTWTEGVYPFSGMLIGLPSRIPWASYSYRGPSWVQYPALSGWSENEQRQIAELEALVNAEGVNAALAAAAARGNGNGEEAKQNNNNEPREMTPEEEAELLRLGLEIEGIHIKEVQAKCVAQPYVYFGGAACELYSARFSREGGPKLHDNVDPTGDLDISVRPLETTLIGEETAEESGTKRIFTMVDETKTTLSPLYEHFSHWIFDRLVELLRPLESSFSGPEFFPKTSSNLNIELIFADLTEQIGNILVTRAITRNMIKIQCGIGVQNQGVSKMDHFCEFIISLDNKFMEVGAEKKYIPYARDIFTIENVPVPGSPPLFVEGPYALLNHQAKGFNDRIKLRDGSSVHKLYNHYERMIFALNLCVFLAERGVIPSGREVGRLMPQLIIALLNGNFFYENPPPCYGRCEILKIMKPLKTLLGKESTDILIPKMKIKLAEIKAAEAAAVAAKAAAAPATAVKAANGKNNE